MRVRLSNTICGKFFLLCGCTAVKILVIASSCVRYITSLGELVVSGYQLAGVGSVA